MNVLKNILLFVPFLFFGIVGNIEADDFNLNHIRLAPSGDFFGIETTAPIGDGKWSVRANTHFSKKLLVLTDQSGAPLLSILSDRFSTEFLGAYGTPFLDFGAAIPIIFHQGGPGRPIAGIESVSESGIGDVRVFARRRLIGGRSRPFGLGVSLDVDLPTSTADFSGSDFVSALPMMSVDWEKRYVTTAVNLGARIRKTAVVQNVSLGNAFHFGGGLALRNRWIPKLTITGEIQGDMNGFTSDEEKIPIQFQSGARYVFLDHLDLSVGYGRGLTAGVGSGGHEGFFMLTYRPLGIDRGPKYWTAPHVTIVGDVISTQREITFVSESDQIESTSEGMLRELAETIQANPSIKAVKVEVYTDPSESPAAALHLAMRRARAIQAAFGKLGIPEERIQAKGFLAYDRLQTAKQTQVAHTLQFRIINGAEVSN